MGSTDINPVVTMKRPAILAIILFFLLSTAAFAPFAYRLGEAHGATLRAEMLQNNTVSEAYMKRLGSREGCPLLGADATFANRRFVVDCLPEGSGGLRAKSYIDKTGSAKPRRIVKTIFDAPINSQANAHPTPLDQAVMASLTGQGNGAPNSPENPLSVAMAPFQNGASPSVFQNSGSFGGGGGGFLPGIGLPNNLIPPNGAQPNGPGPNSPNPPVTPTNRGNDPETPIFEIPDGGFDPTDDPDLVTPIPAALPLMLTGLAGLFAARRRKITK